MALLVPCPLTTVQEVLVLEAEQMANGTAQAMAIHAIPAPMSPDLLHSLGSGGE